MPQNKTCPVCQSKHSRRGATCSPECAAAMRGSATQKTEKECELCGNVFLARRKNSRFCDRLHYSVCENCGKKFPIPKGSERRVPRACSFSCGAALSHAAPGNREKRRENSLKKWGTENPLQAQEVKERIRLSASRKKTEKKDLFKDTPRKKQKASEAQKKSTVSSGQILKGFLEDFDESARRRWKSLLEDATGTTWFEGYTSPGLDGSIGLFSERRDGKILLVDICPTKTHNTHRNMFLCAKESCPDGACEKHTLPKMFHYDLAKKVHDFSLTPEGEGVLPVTLIFDWADEEKMLNFIRSRMQVNRKVYARNTVVSRISQRDANTFFDRFHMLGPSRKQDYCYALRDKASGEILHVESFAPIPAGKELEKKMTDRGVTPSGYESKALIPEKDDRFRVFEAKRSITVPGVTVVGGISRLTSRFMKDAEPDAVVAYSNLSLSWPDYDVRYNGFERDSYVSPQRCWSKDNRMILARSAAFQSADRLIGIANDSKNSPYPEDMTNDQVFFAEGWLPIYDCGSVKDIWIR